MTSKEDKERELEILRDARMGRKFTLADLIAREGGGFLKGESPVPKMIQIKTEINLFIRNNLKDLSGALQAVLVDLVNSGDDKISSHDTEPLKALTLIIEDILSNEHKYYDFVKQVDLKWGQMNGERPYFQSVGQPPHPEDEYTHESVGLRLLELLEIINQQTS
ncbi:hypothetical protein ACN4EE_22355 [Geminocystis sp. CENA526]|uniref:hypothetical protein n=1 Tax=Geminocystis sp. CENA526 TaxID=1355871 RepID=UPI003D6DD2C1